MRTWPVAVVALSLAVGLAGAAEWSLEVAAGESDRIEAPVCAEVALPADLAAAPADELAAQLDGPDGKVPAQLLPAAEKGKAVLWWAVGSLKAGQKAAYRATVSRGQPEAKGFAFQDEPGKHLDLLYEGRKVTRFMYARDAATKETHLLTYKPFTHVFDAKGERVITNDHGEPYPHHRGIFIGWSRVRLADGKTGWNFWEMGGGACQRVEKPIEQQGGPVLGRMRAAVRWEDGKGEAVILEEREITVYRRSRPELLLDFVSTLRSRRGDLTLDGDPEHAGCQFRAHSDVAAQFKDPRKLDSGVAGKETRYLLLPGMKEGAKGTLDMPWAAVSFALGESRFAVAHLNHPANPKGTVYSANRAYARFGAFPKATLKANEPLTLRYRCFVREGQGPLTVEEAQRLHDDFARPPQVTLKP